MKKYKIKQYPQNKDLSLDSLSIEQIWARDSMNSIHRMPEDTTEKENVSVVEKSSRPANFISKTVSVQDWIQPVKIAG